MQQSDLSLIQGFKNKKVFITGNTGFKGSWLCLWLLHLGAKVYGYADGVPTTPSNFDLLKLKKQIHQIKGDIRDFDLLHRTIHKINPDFVFHLAAQPIVKRSYLEPLYTVQTNVMGTTNLLECLRLHEFPCTAIFITSDKCYQNVGKKAGYKETDPMGGKDLYSASKGTCELLIRAYHQSFFSSKQSNIRLVSLRAGNIIGGGDWTPYRLVPDCIRAWATGEKVYIRQPQSIRPWQYILDLLQCYLRVALLLQEKADLNGKAYNLGPSALKSYTVLDLIKALGQIWGTQAPYEIVKNSNFHEEQILKLNCERAQKELNWKAQLSISQMAQLTVSWYQMYYQNPDKLLDFATQQITYFNTYNTTIT